MSNDCPPLVSIVTINRNAADDLRRTLEMTSGQSTTEFEQIVVDGGSTDGSVDLIRDSAFRVDRWVSEPDRGIYDAQNKGIRLARGKFMLFLNSGDHFIDKHSLASAIARLDDSDLQAFDLQMKGIPGAAGVRDFVMHPPASVRLSFFARSTLPHPSTFIKRDLFERYGYYDTELKIASDWKAFILWTCKYHCSYRPHPIPLSVFYGNGVSCRPESADLIRAERRRVMEAEFPAVLADVEELEIAREAVDRLAVLRTSRKIRLLQAAGLLRKF